MQADRQTRRQTDRQTDVHYLNIIYVYVVACTWRMQRSWNDFTLTRQLILHDQKLLLQSYPANTTVATGSTAGGTGSSGVGDQRRGPSSIHFVKLGEQMLKKMEKASECIIAATDFAVQFSNGSLQYTSTASKENSTTGTTNDAIGVN
eukprot:Lankesteria_metandrocarpae@DN4128_c0_g1_i1.p1